MNTKSYVKLINWILLEPQLKMLNHAIQHALVDNIMTCFTEVESRFASSDGICVLVLDLGLLQLLES